MTYRRLLSQRGVGYELRWNRQRLGLTVAELAELTGSASEQIYALEEGGPKGCTPEVTYVVCDLLANRIAGPVADPRELFVEADHDDSAIAASLALCADLLNSYRYLEAFDCFYPAQFQAPNEELIQRLRRSGYEIKATFAQLRLPSSEPMLVWCDGE